MATAAQARLLTLYPVGSRVRATANIVRSYEDRFNPNVVYLGTILGHSVYEGEGSECIHVKWDGDFRGHTVGNNPQEYRGEGDTGERCPGHCWWVSSEMIEVIPGGTVAAAEPVPEMASVDKIARIKVTLKYDKEYNYGRGYWRLTVQGIDVAHLERGVLKGYLDKKYKGKLSKYEWNRPIEEVAHYLATRGVSPDEIVSSITSMLIDKQAREETGVFTNEVIDAELARDIASQPVMVAIGDKLFKLQPSGVLKSTRAMQMVRDRMVNKAKVRVEQIINNARLESGQIIRNGERKLTEMQNELDKKKREMANLMVIPTWIFDNRIPVRPRSSDGNFTLEIGVGIVASVTGFQWMCGHDYIVRWNVVPPSTLETGLSEGLIAWIPWNKDTGRYDYHASHLYGGGAGQRWDLPHLTGGGCCMELQGLPEFINNFDQYKKFCEVYRRGNSYVNLSSLLQRSIGLWHPDVAKQVPTEVKDLVNGAVRHEINGRLAAIGLTSVLTRGQLASVFPSATVESTKKESEETFSPERLAEITRRAEQVRIDNEARARHELEAQLAERAGRGM